MALWDSPCSYKVAFAIFLGASKEIFVTTLITPHGLSMVLIMLNSLATKPNISICL